MLHPILFGAFPLLSIFSSNIGEARPYELLLPIIFALSLSLALWVALSPFFPDRHKRALLLSSFWLPFYGYGFAVDTARSWFHFDDMLNPLQLALTGISSALIFGAPIYWLARTPRKFETATQVLNSLSICCVVISGFSLGYGLFQQHKYTVNRVDDHAPINTASGDSRDYPDIYYLILDAYTRADYLEQAFDYDNGPFLSALSERGFLLPTAVAPTTCLRRCLSHHR